MRRGTDGDYSREQLHADLMRLGVSRSSILLVHASMRNVQPLHHDPAVVADALLHVLGDEGTLVVPTYTSWNSTSSPAFRAATECMTPEQLSVYRESMPAFDPLLTPAWGMGTFAEYVRTHPEAVRSTHPQTSFAAVGARSIELMSKHDLDCHLGDQSPLGAMYRADAFVLMLGTEYSTSSVFHLAECRHALKPLREYQCRTADKMHDTTNPLNGWVSFEDVDFDDSDFHLLGSDFESMTGCVHRGSVGGAQSLLFRVRSAVDFAAHWLPKNRQ